MSADEFWRDDPQLFVSYRTSFFNKKQREMEETDYKCWLQGLYIHDGNGKLMASLKQMIANIVSGFTKGGKKDKFKIDTYPERPYFELARLNSKEEKQKLEIDKEKEMYTTLIYQGSIKQAYRQKIRKAK